MMESLFKMVHCNRTSKSVALKTHCPSSSLSLAACHPHGRSALGTHGHQRGCWQEPGGQPRAHHECHAQQSASQGCQNCPSPCEKYFVSNYTIVLFLNNHQKNTSTCFLLGQEHPPSRGPPGQALLGPVRPHSRPAGGGGPVSAKLPTPTEPPPLLTIGPLSSHKLCKVH